MQNSALKIILRRIISSLIILFLMISFIFILLRISPGDPTLKFISPELSPEFAEQVKESFGLNGSIFDQYIRFIKNLLIGNFGISYNYRTSVIEVIMEFLPFSIFFSLICFFIQLTLSTFFALFVFKRKGTLLDKLFDKAALIIYSTPQFVLAIILILIFSVSLKWFPSSDLKSINFSELSFFEKLIDYSYHLVLPIVTLSIGGTIVFYKYLRDNFDFISKKSFVVYLRSNGISENEILLKHILPNAAGPIISIAGIELGLLLSGSLITEVIFGLPGIGRLSVNAVLLRDYPLVIGCTFITGTLVILANFIADIIKIKIDKRLVKEILN